MIENEIKSYIELGILVSKIEAQAYNIEKSDLNLQVAYWDQYPYFDASNLVKLRKDALKEYYEMLVLAFLYSCRFTYETTDPTVLKAINACVERLNTVIASRGFSVQLVPMARTLFDLYNCAHAKLLKTSLKENASQLEQLRYRIFKHWTAVRLVTE